MANKFITDEQEYQLKWNDHTMQLKRLQACCTNHKDWQEIEDIVNRLYLIINRNSKEHALEEQIKRDYQTRSYHGD